MANITNNLWASNKTEHYKAKENENLTLIWVKEKKKKTTLELEGHPSVT